MNITHQSLQKRWITEFKYKDTINEDSISSHTAKLHINTENQRSGTRAIFNVNIPAGIKNS